MIPSIKIENLSKQYRLGQVGTGTLSHDLKRWWHLVRGKEDPYLKIGEVNDRSTKGISDYVWALKDINFEVQQGEVLGIIGKNGAGKSTLLKILSKVTAPTTGSITYKGRIASLLEVGTGFNPELTGRENLYLNGAILGMRKQEIDSKFDEIVDFSGCERYIDTPTKRYSSGMTVRLGFAVAAFLEPEILVVDEVLAVGDAEFQKKAIGKMKDVSRNDGRTVLFVSHNLPSVKSLCKKGIVLTNGSMVFSGKIDDSINYYIGNNYYENQKLYFNDLNNAPGNENIRVKLFEVKPLTGAEINVESGLNFKLQFYNYKANIMLDTTFQFSTMDDIIYFSQGYILTPEKDSKVGFYQVEFNLPPNLFNAGKYKMRVWFGENQTYMLWESLYLYFEIENTLTGQGGQTGIPIGALKLKIDFNSNFL